ncbi:MAG: hypothetical protein IPO93_00205 [Actinobacteria bacterium]|nr:hypothetical protein [Actinomycetota bacterium]
MARCRAGDVDALGDVACRDAASLAADHPHGAVRRAHQVLGGEGSVADLVLVQRADGPPGLLEVAVGDLVEVGEAGPVDVLVGEQAGVGADLDGQEEPGLRRAGSLGGEGHECGVVEGLSHVEGARGAVVAQPQARVDRVGQPRALEVAVEDRHDELAARSRGGDVAAPARGGLACLQHRDGVAAAAQGVGHLQPAGPGGGRADGVPRDQSHSPADRQRDRHPGKGDAGAEDRHDDEGADDENGEEVPGSSADESGHGDEGDEPAEDGRSGDAVGARGSGQRRQQAWHLGRRERHGDEDEQDDREEQGDQRVEELAYPAAHDERDRGGDGQAEGADAPHDVEDEHHERGQQGGTGRDVRVDALGGLGGEVGDEHDRRRDDHGEDEPRQVERPAQASGMTPSSMTSV